MLRKEEKRKLKVNLILVSLSIIIYLVLSNLEPVLGFISNKIVVFQPLIIGFILAFLLNIPLTFFEEKLLGRLFLKFKKLGGAKRGISLLLTFITIILILFGIGAFALPQFATSVKHLYDQIPDYIISVQEFITKFSSTYDINEEILLQATKLWQDFLNSLTTIALRMAESATGFVSSIMSGVISTLLSLIFAIYMLASKEKLIAIIKKTSHAFMNNKVRDKTHYVVNILNRSFTNFIRGQVTEAFIIGVLCFIGMSIFRFEYALLISVIVGLTNVIPIFGPFIGSIPSALLLAMVDPKQAFFFIIFVIVLQQIESNLIYPKVVGTSMGLSGFWVLTAVVIGNSLYGMLGIILGIPIFSTLYTIIKDVTNKRLEEKKLLKE